jgi:hypothetical protein
MSGRSGRALAYLGVPHAEAAQRLVSDAEQYLVVGDQNAVASYLRGDRDADALATARRLPRGSAADHVLTAVLLEPLDQLEADKELALAAKLVGPAAAFAEQCLSVPRSAIANDGNDEASAHLGQSFVEMGLVKDALHTWLHAIREQKPARLSTRFLSIAIADGVLDEYGAD